MDANVRHVDVLGLMRFSRSKYRATHRALSIVCVFVCVRLFDQYLEN